MTQHALWVAFPPRQLTGGPGFVYHAYVGRDRPEMPCCKRDHRKAARAMLCAKQLAKKLNRLTRYGAAYAEARLRAAAPALLAAARSALLALLQNKPDDYTGATIRDLQAAIAKATGGES